MSGLFGGLMGVAVGDLTGGLLILGSGLLRFQVDRTASEVKLI